MKTPTNTTWWLFFALALMLFFMPVACDNSAGTAADGDVADGDCDCPYGCDDNGTCLGQPCQDDIDCPSGMLCEDGVCTSTDPVIDGDTIDGDSDGKPILDGDIEDDGTDDPADGDSEFGIDFETDIPHSDDNPWIQVEPLLVDFGAVPLWSTLDKQVRISNIGMMTLVVDDLYLYYERNDTLEELTLQHDSLPLEISTMQEAFVTVSFAPQDMNPDTDLLVIHSNDPSEPNVGVHIITDVKATGTFSVQPQAIEFGEVRLGNYSQTVVLENRGGLDIFLFRLELESDSPEITVEGIPADISQDTPYRVRAGEDLELTVHYDPVVDDGAEDSGILHIRCSDEITPIYEIPISGTPCEPDIDVLPAALDYSGVALGSSDTQCTTVTNAGCHALTITDIAIEDDADGAFTWQTDPGSSAVLQPEEELELCITFTPTSLDQDSGLLVITSDDLDEGHVEVPLSSEVIPADIECEPEELAFGPVPIGSSKTLTLTCRNKNAAPLSIDYISIEYSPGLLFEITNQPETELGLGEETTIDVTYSPTAEQEDTAVLSIVSNDPDESPFDTPMSGEGYEPNTCPVAQISVADPPVDEIEQFMTVTFNGADSYDPDAGDSIAAYSWTVISRPLGSTSVLQNPTDVRPTLEMDRAGDYTVQLEVEDQSGEPSCVAATLTITAAVPPPDLLCEPVTVDFGSVAVGDSLSRYVTCRNMGRSTVVISQYEVVTPAAGVFSLVGSPLMELGFSENVFLELSYAPIAVGDDEGQLRIHSNDADQPIIEITLRGGNYIPNTCPEAVIDLVSPTGDIFTGDTVRLSGANSSDPDAGDGIYQYIWSFESTPIGSQSEIRPFGNEQPSFYVDMPGTYVVKLIVKDNQQLVSCNVATLQINTETPPPDIVCTPMIVNYGVLPIGSEITETVTCYNVGRGVLHLSSYVVAPSGGPFSLTNTPETTLYENDTTTFDVRYAPTSPSSINGTLTIQSNDPDEASVVISLVGNSFDPNNCPVPVINVTSPNLDYLKPLDTVQFNGASSYDPDAGDGISEYIWSVVTRPSGSTSQLQTSSDQNPTFFVDLAGTYQIKLEVRDQQGMLSCSPAYIELNAIPREIIHVQLVWDTDEGDMDLHLIRPGGSMWGSSDCYYDNLSPNWSSYGRPSLDIDDQHGYGPENINLDDPGAGTYRVYAHYYNSWGEHSDVTTTVRIYIYGELRGSFVVDWPESYEHYRWPVADIAWDGLDAVVTGLGTNFESDGHGQKGLTGPPKKK